MKKVFKIAFVSAAGWLMLMASQQARAQVVFETPEGIELRQDTYEEILENFRPLVPKIPAGTEMQELRFFDGTPLLQNNLPGILDMGGEATRDGLPLEACGWVSNGDGTVNFTGSCETEP